MQEAAHPTARVLPWMFAWGGLDAGLTVAAKAGADAPGGGIFLCICRRGCAAPAKNGSQECLRYDSQGYRVGTYLTVLGNMLSARSRIAAPSAQ